MRAAQAQIQFKDFSPNEEQKNKLFEVLDKVTEHLPSGVTVKSFVQHTGRVFTGKLHLYSKWGHIVAQASADDMTQLASKLKQKVMKQFRSFKTKRVARRHKNFITSS